MVPERPVLIMNVPRAFGVSWASRGEHGKVRVTHAAEVPQRSVFPGSQGEVAEPPHAAPASVGPWGRSLGKMG